MTDLAHEVIRVLLRFKNAVVEGPPGTGKTYVVGGVASAWEEATGRPLDGKGTGDRAITFHPSTTYEDFIEGLRYDEDAQRFETRPGFLRRIIEHAEGHPEYDYLVLLDELNRANVPKVLGDVLLCMEASKRSRWDSQSNQWTDGMTATLPYSGDTFSMPDNIYLLGTMNSSDRSIAPLDTALRRRFGFIRTAPLSGENLKDEIESVEGADAAERVTRSIEELTNLNEVLLQCLGPDALLGHSYLFGLHPVTENPPPPNDPLAELHDIAVSHGSTRGFWLEVGGMWGGSQNQLDVPDHVGHRRGLVDEFYPMTSGGVTTDAATGDLDPFDLYWRSQRLEGNTLQYNEGGSNQRVKLKGRNTAGQGLTRLLPVGALAQKIHVWLARSDNTFDFVVLDRSPSMVSALSQVSTWTERTQPGTGGRAYGVIDISALTAPGVAAPRSPDEDAEWLTWRYAILPQLVDTVTQLGASELLDRATRAAWLEANGQTDVADRLEQFDEFMGNLGLDIVERGYGLSRALVIEDIPVVEPARQEDLADDVGDARASASSEVGSSPHNDDVAGSEVSEP